MNNQELQKVESQSVNWKPLIIIIGAIIVFYFLFMKENSSDSIETSQKELENRYLSNSPEAQLSIINDHAEQPQQTTFNLFSYMLSSLGNRYSNNSKSQIANALVAAHNILIQNGNTESLLEFTTAFEAYSKELNKNLGLTIEENLAFFLKEVYQL